MRPTLHRPRRLLLALSLGCSVAAPAAAQGEGAGPPAERRAEDASEPAGRVVPPRVEEADLAPPTPAATDAGVHGAVLLRLTVDEAGRVSDVEIVQGLGFGLDEAAAAAARGFRFVPATVDGVPAPARVLFRHDFPRPTPPAPPAPGPRAPTPPPGGGEAAAGAEAPIEVVVTGARIRERADRAVVATEVIDRETIERGGYRDAAELLEESSTIQVDRTFRGAGVWLRGLAPEYTLVLVDGERLPGTVGGVIDLSRYGVENVERVEIVRGPSSALYGSEAIGGVVNLITRPASRDLEADAMASYGTAGVLDATARVAGRPVDGLRLSLTGGYHQADAFRFDEGSAATSGSARRQGSVGGRAVLDVGDAHELRLQGNFLRLRLEGVDTGAGSAVFDRTQLQEQIQAGFGHRFDAGTGVVLESRFSYGLYREQYLLDQRGSNRLDDYEDNREHLAQLTSTLAVDAADDHRVTVGFEQIIQRLESERLSTPGNRTRFAVFAEDRWQVTDWLAVTPGVRVDLDSQFGEQVSPKLALRADPVEGLVLRASYGRGFRAPSFQELLLRFENPTVGYVVEGNPDLDAERSHGVDVGFEWRALPWLEVSGSFFRNDLDQMIAVVTGDEGVAGTLLTYDNLETAWTMGAESSARVRAGDLLTVGLGYTFTATRDGENDRELEGRARHRPTASATLTWDEAEVDVTARSAVQVGRVFFLDEDGDGAEERVVADPLAQLDLRVAKRFGRHVEIFAGVDNVLGAGDRFTVFRPRVFYAGARGRY